MKASRKYGHICIGRVLLLLSALIAISGCIKDDRDGCPDGFYLRFEAVNPKHRMAELIETVDIYVYDRNGKLFREYNFGKEQLRYPDCAAFIGALENGNFRIVSAINQGNLFQVYDKKDYMSLRTGLPAKTAAENMPLLFTGEQTLALPDYTFFKEELTVAQTKHNNHITIDISFDDKAVGAIEKPEVFIKGDNSGYRFATKDSREGEPVLYLPYEEVEAIDQYRYRITTLRLTHGGDIKVHIRKPGESDNTWELETVLDLVDELAKIKDEQGNYLYDTDEKLDFEDEYLIKAVLRMDYVIVSMTINGWSVIRGETGV